MQKNSLLSNKPWIRFFAILFPVTIITFHPGFRFRILTILLTIVSSKMFYFIILNMLSFEWKFLRWYFYWKLIQKIKVSKYEYRNCIFWSEEILIGFVFHMPRKYQWKMILACGFEHSVYYSALFPWPFKNYRLAAKCKSFNFNTQKNISCEGKKRL